MRYWFVNLGTYYKEQRDGRFLWAPLYDRNGRVLAHWDSLKDVSRGDIILCNNNGIVSVGVAKNHAYLSDIPNEFEQTWQKEGRRIDLRFIDLDKPLKYQEYMTYIKDNINPDLDPFDRNGHAKLGDLYPIDENIAVYLLHQMNNEEVNGLLTINDLELKFELEELEEETEQFEKISNGSIQSYSPAEASMVDNEDYEYVPRIETNNNSVLREKTDPRLKATRMEFANHLCEINHEHKTFTNASGNYQYLECHHIIPMSAQKDFPNVKLDSMFNLIALCPICHMQVHYATKDERGKVFLQMYKLREQEMLNYGFDLATMNKIFNKYYLKK